MAGQKLTGGAGVEQASIFTTAVIQPGAQRLVLVFVGSARPGLFASAPSIPTVNGVGLAWQQVNTSASGDRRLTCFRAMGQPVSGPLIIDFAGEAQDHCAWTVVEYDGVDTTGVGGAAAIAQSKPATAATAGASVALAPSTDPSRNPTVAAVMLALADRPSKPVTPGAGFTEIDEQGVTHTPFGKSTTLQVQDSAISNGTILWTWSGAENSASIAIELKAAPVVVTTPPPPGTTPTDPVEALVRRFEPVLTFHPDEQFFPVDAKRFVESAALWSANWITDDKATWSGVPGDPFPRQPLVTGGSLAAVSGESGKYLDDPALQPSAPTVELFLELGGWKDLNEAHVGEVSADSANLYADRSEIARRYREDLEPSRFWYHAEIFDLTRLSILAAGVGGIPEVAKAFASYREPTLLCYYFFFPAHVQSVGQDSCTNIEAKEVSCHAGDWQCMALLLDGDNSGKPESYTPKFFGHTGLPTGDGRPSDTHGRSVTAMHVEAWKTGGEAPLMLTTVGDHPHLYVAAGTHSLYTTPGTHEVNPYWEYSKPLNCGRIDGTDIELLDSGVTEAFETLLIKALAAGLFGAFGLGLIAGWIEAIANLPDLPEPTPPDPIPPDSTAIGPTGTTARPAGLDVPGIAGTFQDWRVARDLSVGGRTYDFVVDRDTQGFWPHDDGVRGYRGNWGQPVSPGAFRRGGRPFPPFWQMFLTAVEYGVTTKQLTI